MKRLASLLVMLVLVVSIGIAVVLSSEVRESPRVSGSPKAPVPTGAPIAKSPAPTPVAMPESFAFGEPNTPSPGETGQSRLWFHDGEWWGVFLNGPTGDQRVFRFDANSRVWADTGVAVDERAFALMDIVSDGDRVVIASAGPQPEPRHALRIVRFSYDPAARIYRRDANFPIPITDAGVESLTAARSDDGRLWVAYRQGALMAIDHSLDSELAWRGPFVPTVAGGPIEEVAVASLGDRIAVVWTRPTGDVVSMAWHDTDGPPDIWQTSPDARVAGLSLGEDQLSVATDRSPGAERLFAAVRTSAEESPDAGRLDSQVLIIEFSTGSDPIAYLFGRVAEQHAGAIVLVESEARMLYVIAAAPKVGGAIYYKGAPLDRITFQTGLGTLLIPATDDHSRLANPTSTKQALDGDSGMMIAASDRLAGVYAFAAVDVEGEATETPAPSDHASAAATLVDNTFDGLTLGAQVPGWEVEGEPLPAFAIRVLAGSNSSARLSASATDARACVGFRDVSDGVLSAEAEALFNLPSDELRLLQVRGVGGELASIRLREGQVTYSNGAEFVRSELVLAPGRWYRSVITLDLATKAYSLELYDAADDALLLQDDGLAWRTDSTIVNRVCAELPPQPGLDLYLDDVRVTTTNPEGS